MKHIPNILTVLRLLACPLLIYLFYSKKHLAVLIIFLLACITDFFDGYLARKKNFKSNIGKILDPIADKALIITMCIMLIINENVLGVHKLAFYIIILGEILVTSLRFNLYIKNKSLDVSQLSKYKTFIQMIAISSILSYELIPNYRLIILFILWFAVFTSIISGIQHFKTYLKLK